MCVRGEGSSETKRTAAEKKTGHERHTAAGRETLEDVLPLKSKLVSVAMTTQPIG